jgi:endonuclease/exonuclease/phosphatase family metal-dependent hydrolase
MKDTAEAFEGERLSYPSYGPEIKIDYIFVSKVIEIKSADIPATVCSDHRPHIAEIEI